MIDWTIDEAIKSKKITDIVITTPDENIIRHVNKKYKDILTYKRDLRLARFDISLDEALTDLFENIRLELKIEKNFYTFHRISISILEIFGYGIRYNGYF